MTSASEFKTQGERDHAAGSHQRGMGISNSGPVGRGTIHGPDRSGGAASDSFKPQGLADTAWAFATTEQQSDERMFMCLGPSGCEAVT